MPDNPELVREIVYTGGASVSGAILGKIGRDSNVSKSIKRLHVDIFRFPFTDLGYYSIFSSEMISDLLKS